MNHELTKFLIKEFNCFTFVTVLIHLSVSKAFSLIFNKFLELQSNKNILFNLMDLDILCRPNPSIFWDTQLQSRFQVIYSNRICTITVLLHVGYYNSLNERVYLISLYNIHIKSDHITQSFLLLLKYSCSWIQQLLTSCVLQDLSAKTKR